MATRVDEFVGSEEFAALQKRGHDLIIDVASEDGEIGDEFDATDYVMDHLGEISDEEFTEDERQEIWEHVYAGYT